MPIIVKEHMSLMHKSTMSRISFVKSIAWVNLSLLKQKIEFKLKSIALTWQNSKLKVS